MAHADPAPLALIPHRETPSAAVRAIDVRALAVAGGLLRFEYVMRGDLARVRLPAQVAGARAHGLWRHTCFEAFIATAPLPGYLELNFSPSGQWAAYGFSDYRQDQTLVSVAAPRIFVRRELECLALEATVQWPRLPPAAAAASRDAVALQLGLSAVVEEESGALSYWALGHRGARPDFHDRRAFSLELHAL